MSEPAPARPQPTSSSPATNARHPREVASAASAPHRFRLTVRTRLALTYAALLTLAGALMMIIIYVVLGYLPTYAFTVAAVPATAATEAAAYGEAAPIMPGYDTGISATEAAPGILVASRDDVQQLILVVAAIVLAILAAGGTWAGWFIAGRMLRPLQEINVAAHRAARGHLDHRIGLQGPRDEISDLADTFDEMLDELERSFLTYRRFAANASHELRTPLATTRAMLDVALSSARPAERPLFQRLRETNERSIATVESLLDLSDVEASSVEHASVALDRVTEAVLAECAPEADAAGIRIDYRLAATTVNGDAVLLRQLITNLVQNAIRHNIPGGFVVVATTAAVRGNAAFLEVANSGPPVPLPSIGSLTDPFFRPEGRTNESSARGRGLGLSIVRAIADRHEATLNITARKPGGLTVRVEFTQ
jgi:two-component system sensor histidine kinase VanS